MAKRGFTLVEVLVAILLVAVGVVGILGGLRSVGAAEAAVRDGELLQRLAFAKADEISATGDSTSAGESGDFTDQGYPNIEWSYSVEASGEQNISKVTLEVTRGGALQTVNWLVYVRPATVLATE